MGLTSASSELMSDALRRIQEDQNRADFLDFLYELDGRKDPSHPHCGTYTGLYQEYAYSLSNAALREISEQWHTYELAGVAKAAERNDSGAVES
jgi:hypothetical protein